MKYNQLCWIITLLFTSASTFAAERHWDVIETGAIGDGNVDCTDIFQTLLDAAGKAGGGIVHVPAGKYRIDGNLAIPANVTLQGVYRVAPTPAHIASDKLAGSVLCAYAGRESEKGPPFINLAGDNSAIVGLIVYFPEWKRSDVPSVPYQLTIGRSGDEYYLRGWHGRDGQNRRFRWTKPSAKLLLPVVPGELYSITLEIKADDQAVSPDTGLYLDGKQITSLRAGTTLTAVLPPSHTDQVKLELRYSRRQLPASSKDRRALGIQVFSVTMFAEGAGNKIFDANTGEWFTP